jgi:hypothetical protein
MYLDMLLNLLKHGAKIYKLRLCPQDGDVCKIRIILIGSIET